MNDKVIACVDDAPAAAEVCDLAAWAASRLDAPLELLHVLDRHPERAAVADYSGSIGLGAQEALLQELGAIDEQRSQLAQRQGRELLDALVRRAQAAGAPAVEARQRHGGLVDSLLELESQARLIVLGRSQTGPAGRHAPDHDLERVVRSVQRPVLVAAGAFRAPSRFGIAFDGSATARKMVETLATRPLLQGLPCELVMVGDDTADHREALEWARQTLAAVGFEVRSHLIPGELESALPRCLAELGIDLLGIGAYGHSRIRQLIVGSTTTLLLRTSPVPVLVLR